MISRRSRTVSVAGGILLAGLALGFANCGKDSIVDGVCSVSFTQCDLTCVDTSNDRNNCGGCGIVCPVGINCSEGYCNLLDDGGLISDGAALDGGDADDDGPEGGGDATLDQTNDGVSSDGEGDGSAIDGDGSDGASVCTPPYTSAAHCGSCAVSCTGATPKCALGDGGYACQPLCTLPQEDCGGSCVNKATDERNCGACGNVCETGICVASQCIGAGFGHIVVIGMDYTVAYTNQPPAFILGNAAFLAAHNPVRILTYGEYADPGAVTQVGNMLTWASGRKGRSTQMTSAATAAQALSSLKITDYDAFLVYDQPLAPPGVLATTGASWSNAIDLFTKAGGVVIALDGGTGKLPDGGAGAGEMKSLITSAGLLPVTAETDVTGTNLVVSSPGDAVGLNAATPFIARKNTVAFTTSQAADGTHGFVVENAGQTAPVVVHVVKVP